MPITLEDPTMELLNRKREMDTRDPFAVRDDQELRERELAARAYAGEDERHFVDYANDCVEQSVEAMKDVREIQSACWRVYNEDEPASYGEKEEWMSRIVVPKPFSTVQYGASAVKKAFSPNFLSITNPQNEKHAHKLRFTDASTMGLAVGISQELIPRWVRGKGLEYILVEPWKIHRDPDALPRDPQSGMFWVHQEWLDYFCLKQGEQEGRYFDVARVKETEGDDPDDPMMSKEAIRARKKETWNDRSQFRKMILTSEFWGMVLSPKGEVLLPRATYTVAGGRVIQKPTSVPYRTLRWPGVAFSPLPDLLRFGGRGLLQGVLSIWEAMCNLMCLHNDYLQWVVNPPAEINVDGLVDPNDVERWPGKEYLVRDTPNGQQVVRLEQRRSRTSDALSNFQGYDQQFQRGSFVTDAVQGLPGYRKDMTFREAAMNLDQAMGVYGLMGENIENGAIFAIMAGQEVAERYARYEDYLALFPEEELMHLGVMPNPEVDSGVSGVPPMDGSFHVSGIQALLRDNETMQAIKEVIIPLSTHPRFGPYINHPYRALKAIEERTNLTDEHLIATEKEASAIEAQQQEQQAQATAAMERGQDLQEAQGVADLMGKVLPGMDRAATGARMTNDGGEM